MRIFLLLLFSGLVKGEDVDFGWITPVHIPEGSCSAASQRYIEALGDMSWGAYMLDADGRLPLEGFLSDTTPFPIPLCDLLGSALPNCKQLPSYLTNVVLHVPIGFAGNAGNMDLCLDEGVHTKLGVKTQYCSIAMVPPEIDTEGADTVTPGLRVRQSQSYFDKIANLLEVVDRLKRIDSLELDNEENRTTINGFGQFEEHMRKIQMFSKAEPGFSSQQVENFQNTCLTLTFPDSWYFHGNLCLVEHTKNWDVLPRGVLCLRDKQ